MSQRQIFAKLLSGTDVFATTALVIFLDLYGPEGLTWLPETINKQLQDDIGVVSPAAFERLMAAITVLTTDRFYRTVGGFIPIANALNGRSANSDFLNLPDAYECAWAITEARLISPDADSGGFSLDVSGYVAAALRNEGFMTPPRSLRFVVGEDALSYDNSAITADPLSFRSVYEAQSARAADLDSEVSERLRSMISQIESLKLSNGSASNLTERLTQTLKRN